MKTQLALTATLLAAGLSPASAASSDAWANFQSEVSRTCVAAAKGLIENGKALVDPFGSASYGMAVVSGKAVGAKITVSTICVFDKKTRKAEIGGEISSDKLAVNPGK